VKLTTDSDLRLASQAGLLSEQQFKDITAFLNARAETPAAAKAPRFDLTHVLWYAGALTIIGAMGLFTNEAFNRMGGWALVATGVAYAIVLTAIGHYLWRVKGLTTPGGLLIAAAVSMVPMAIYGVQDALDLWKYAQGDPGTYHNFYPYVNGSWLYMEVGTVLAAALAVRFYPFPFIGMIAGVALWFMSMDLAMWFTTTPTDYYDFDVRQRVTIWFGAAVIAIAWAIDVIRRGPPDFGFWLHIFGVLAFWGGITAYGDGSEFDGAIYCALNVALIGFGVFLDRRVYAVVGMIGIATYLGHLASTVFQDMIGFSFALSAIGLAVIGLGLFLNRHYQTIAKSLDEAIPDPLKRLRPSWTRAITSA